MEAEYRLRQLDPTYALVKDDAECFIKRVSGACQARFIALVAGAGINFTASAIELFLGT